MRQVECVMRGPSLWGQGQSSRSSLLALDGETIQRGKGAGCGSVGDMTGS